jgi:hypothetical protein
VYAKKNDEPRVFLVGQYQGSSMNKSTFDLRDKRVMEFDRDKISAVELRTEGRAIVVTKGADNAWRLTKPIIARTDMSRVQNLLGGLETGRIMSVASENATPEELKKYGLDNPTASVDLTIGTEHRIFDLGAKATDTTYYARDRSKPTIVTVDKSYADDFNKQVDDFRSTNVFEFLTMSVTRAEFTRNGLIVVFERQPAGEDGKSAWRRSSPNPADVDGAKVDGLLATLSGIQETTFVPSTANTGLDAPALIAIIKYEGGSKEERVTFGQRGNDVYVSRPDDPGAAKIDSQRFTDTISALDELSKSS